MPTNWEALLDEELAKPTPKKKALPDTNWDALLDEELAKPVSQQAASEPNWDALLDEELQKTPPPIDVSQLASAHEPTPEPVAEPNRGGAWGQMIRAEAKPPIETTTEGTVPMGAYMAQQTRRGVSTLAGLPSDILSGAANLIKKGSYAQAQQHLREKGIIPTPKPYERNLTDLITPEQAAPQPEPISLPGGSEEIYQDLTKLVHGDDYEELTPTHPGQRFLGEAYREAVESIGLGFAGPVAIAQKLAAIKKVRKLTKAEAALHKILGTKSQAIAEELGASALGGVGVGTAAVVAPESGGAKVLGALAGGVSGAITGRAVHDIATGAYRLDGSSSKYVGEQPPQAPDKVIPPGQTVGLPQAVTLPDKKPLNAHWEVVEADSLTTSHNPHTFAPEPNYPQAAQPRDYSADKAAQAKIIENSQTYEPAHTINDAPTAETGPSMVTAEGLVMGGNSRVMSTKLLYDAGNGDTYKTYLKQYADRYGVDPDAVEVMEKPVLIRRLEDTPQTPEEFAAIGADLNKNFTRSLTPYEEAASAGKRMSPESSQKFLGLLDELERSPDPKKLNQIAELEDLQKAGQKLEKKDLQWLDRLRKDVLKVREWAPSVKDLIRTRPKQLLEQLRSDGLISQQQITAYYDPVDGFTERGKEFVESLLLGSIVDDSFLLAKAGKSQLNKISAALAPLSKLKAFGPEWDLSEPLKEALRTFRRAAEQGKTVDQYLNRGKFSQGLLGTVEDERTADPLVLALIDVLKKDSQKGFRARIREITMDASESGKGLLGGQPVSPADSFARHLGLEGEEAGIAARVMGEPEPMIASRLTGEATADVLGLAPAPAKQLTVTSALEEARSIVGHTPAPKERQSLFQWIKEAPGRFQKTFVEEFQPLRKLEEKTVKARTDAEIAKREASGEKLSFWQKRRIRRRNKPVVNLARRGELVSGGAGGKAEADLVRFRNQVINPLLELYPAKFTTRVREGLQKIGVKASSVETAAKAVDENADAMSDFGTYLFLKRTRSRLMQDAKVKQVGDWTVDRAEAGLRELEAELGSERFRAMENIGEVYQDLMREAMQLQLDSGRITPELFERILAENDFYAPFKVLKYLEEGGRGGVATKLANTEQLTKAITGIKSSDQLQLGDMIQESMKQIYKSRILAEQSLLMQRVNRTIDEYIELTGSTDLGREVDPTRYYVAEYEPAEEILRQLSLQQEPFEVAMTKVGKAIELAREAGLKVTKRMFSRAAGAAEVGGAAFNGRVWINHFTSETIVHELAHAFDLPIAKLTNRDEWVKHTDAALKRLSDSINNKKLYKDLTGVSEGKGAGTYAKELAKVVNETGLGGSAAYRASGVERFAEFVNLYIHNPAKARELAPEFTDLFESKLITDTPVGKLVGKLADFHEKFSGIPNIKTKLDELGGKSYMETAIRTAFPGEKHLAVAFGDKPREGFEIVTFMDQGKVKALELPSPVANALNNKSKFEANTIVKTIGYSNKVFKASTTGLSPAFQAINHVWDNARTAIISRASIGRASKTELGNKKGLARALAHVGYSAKDVVRYPIEYLQAFWDSASLVKVGSTPNEMAMEFLRSGAAGANLQRSIYRSQVFEPIYQPGLKGMIRKNVATALKVTEILEVQGKLVGFRRQMRLEGITASRKRANDLGEKALNLRAEAEMSGTKAAKAAADDADRKAIQAADALEDTFDKLAVETRNFVGSPDFLRKGDQSRKMDFFLPFFNPRMQGIAGDVSRLMGRHGRSEAIHAAARSAIFLGGPTAALVLHNMSDDSIDLVGPNGEVWTTTNKESYAAIPEWERNNYWMFPTTSVPDLFKPLLEESGFDMDDFFINENGERIRNYVKFQKREFGLVVSNIVEAGVQFAIKGDPAAAGTALADIFEHLSPVNIQGETMGERVESIGSNLLPVGRLTSELAMGRDFFRKRSIEPERIQTKPTEQVPTEEIYRRTTPEIYKKLGPATSKIGLSPLQTEHIVKGQTGGLIGQVIGTTGQRPGIQEMPVIGGIAKRLQRSPWTAKSEAERERRESARDINKPIVQAGHRGELWHWENRNLSDPEFERQLEALRQTDPLAAKRAETKRKNRKTHSNLTDDQWSLKYGPFRTVADGARARRIVQRLHEMPLEERAPWVKELEDVRIMSKTVKEQVRTLLEENPLP